MGGGAAASMNACGVGAGDSAQAASGDVPAKVGIWKGIQVQNAAKIIDAASEANYPARAQTIAVMTAMGESSLEVKTYGDAAGPDSRGLYQQRANGWGSLADRLDPKRSTLSFLRALVKVPGWQKLPPTIAAHRTQINADPFHYEPFWDDAVLMVKTLTKGDGDAGDLVDDVTNAACLDGEGSLTGSGGWPVPAKYRTADRHNWHQGGGRWSSWHTGTDFSVPAGTPVFAAHAGVVRRDSAQTGWAGPNFVKIVTGKTSLATWYAHMATLTVDDGDKVKAGQQIGTVGSLGNSSGPHLHFEVHLKNGTIYGPDNVNPSLWLKENAGRKLEDAQ